MTDETVIRTSKSNNDLIEALTADCKWLRDNGIDFVGVERNVQKAIRALRGSHETRELQLLKEARSFIQHDKRCWGASHEDDCTCGYVDLAKKLAFLDEPAKEICAHGKRRDEDCAYCPGSFTAPPIDPWADMKKNCTCPKPGTSSSKIDPLCPIGLPHPWDRDAQKASESPETCHRNGEWSGCWRVRCNLGKKCALGKFEERS